MSNEQYIKDNEHAWDKRAENNDQWSIPVSEEEIAEAKKGNWSIFVTPVKRVPRNWFPEEMKGKKILCLAGGGGQQGPVLAATGADVTVFDNSTGQLGKDQMAAKRDGLTIHTVQGNMQDLSMFGASSLVKVSRTMFFISTLCALESSELAPIAFARITPEM